MVWHHKEDIQLIGMIVIIFLGIQKIVFKDLMQKAKVLVEMAHMDELMKVILMILIIVLV
jgi:hypothetical protein